MSLPAGPMLVGALGVGDHRGRRRPAAPRRLRGVPREARPGRRDRRGRQDLRAARQGRLHQQGRRHRASSAGCSSTRPSPTTPQKSGGLDQALHKVLQQPFGAPLLVVIAVGLRLLRVVLLRVGAAPRPVSGGSHPLRLTVLAAVAVGGAAGALARWGLSEAFPDPVDGFPWTIFGINVLGCLVLALLPAIRRGAPSRPAPAAARHRRARWLHHLVDVLRAGAGAGPRGPGRAGRGVRRRDAGGVPGRRSRRPTGSAR